MLNLNDCAKDAGRSGSINSIEGELGFARQGPQFVFRDTVGQCVLEEHSLKSNAAMINGLYLSAQGAQAQQTRLDVVSNNLANASTTGFKRDLAVFQSHQPFDRVRGNPDNTPVNLEDSWAAFRSLKSRLIFLKMHCSRPADH